MIDLSQTIAPKSDQTNADDLIGGPRTIKITSVRRMSEPDQPIAIGFDGDNGKPYKPGKSMRRVLVHVWGADGNAYVGRRMTIFCDPNVLFGGKAVGGIRISHMSDLDAPRTMALTVTKAKRDPYTVKPLADEKPAVPGARDRLYAAAREAAGKGGDALHAFIAGIEERAAAALKPIMPELNATASQVPAHDADGVLTGDDPDADPYPDAGFPTDDEERI